MSVVVTHPEMGIYLGNCMGFGFFTLLDPAGQSSAVTFADEDQARAHVASWDQANDPDAYSYVQVADGKYATIADLKAAGLAHLLGDMEMDALRNAEPVGNA